jgi:hypothetical protein
VFLRCGPVHSVEIGHGQHPIAGRLVNDLGDVDERVAAVELVECGDVGGFVAVVDFFGDASGDLLRRRTQVGECGAGCRGRESIESSQQFGVGQIVADRFCRTGILDLHCNFAAVVQHRVVDLPDGGGGHRLIAELSEELRDRLSQIGLQDVFG